jgi:ATP-binding cassette, subfamily C, bacterial LapB
MTASIVQPPPPRFARWLAEPMRRNRGTYAKVALAAAMTNIFALVASLFTMTVYDRVVPNNAFASLIALSIGLAIVVMFDFVLRILRAYFVDLAGADIDRAVGATVFDRLVNIRLDLKRGSVGGLTTMMRELETLREFFASATMTAVVDVPFILLTLAVIALIGGWVVLAPLVMIPLVVAVGWLTRPALDRLSARALQEGMIKQSVLVETIGALEMVKTSGAGPLLARRWRDAIIRHSDSGMQQRLVSAIAITVAVSANTLSYAGVVVIGVFMIAAHHLTTGGLVACSILSSRAVAPLAQIAMLLARLSATRTGYRQINEMMAHAPEGPAEAGIRPVRLDGSVELRGVEFRYPGTVEKSLGGINLAIAPGERVGLIGRVGSGKSTLARLILGLYEPEQGVVMIDGTDVRQYDPPALRAKIGAVLQESVLLSGSVRENILLGRGDVEDGEMRRVAELSGTHGFISSIANGYDLKLADRGESLSGGQRQAISLARALVGRPPILIFDEPTSAMDVQSETALLDRLESEVAGRTLLLITHRPALLRLVTRVVLLEAGKIVLDGPRDGVLQQLRQPQRAA